MLMYKFPPYYTTLPPTFIKTRETREREPHKMPFSDWSLNSILFLSPIIFQIAIRANYLEAENERLKEQLKVLRQENMNLRTQITGTPLVAETAKSAENGDLMAQAQ